MDDARVASLYLRRIKNAKKRGITFDLGLMAFRNLMNAKYCYYTGIELTEATGPEQIHSDRTIDRIDNRKGYVSGNVVACSFAANQIKGTWERFRDEITPARLTRFSRLVCDQEKGRSTQR